MVIDDVNAIAVLGAGNMGHGIAEVAALAGFDVALRDIEDDLVREGYEQIEWSLGKLAEKGQIGDGEADEALDRVTPLVDLEEAVADADVVIEAVPERTEVKAEVYAELEEYAPDRTVFATNTSSLSITELSELTDRPERFCGMHFFNPPVRMQLVEVIAGDHTAEETLDLIEDLAEAMDRTPVRVRKDSPGFVVNRVLTPLINEAAWIVHSGEATVAEVDSTAKYDVGLPMGAFELTDQVGLDVGYHVLEYLHETLGDAYEPCPLLVEKVEAGELGRKSGEGFYDYESGEGAQVPGDAGREDVARRLLAVMANEVAALVGDDVADAATVDTAMQLGAGFPDGPARMADEAGLAALVETLDDLREQTGAGRYEVRGYLRDLAASGEGFRADDGDGEGDAAFEFETLSVDLDEGVGHVVLDRPHRLNAINLEMLDELETAIERLEADEEVRAILVSGAGDRAFSAGLDVQSVSGDITDPVRSTEHSRRGQRVLGKLEECPMPVVCAVDGYCLGGAMELSLCADLRVASRRSEFGQTEHNLGLLPGWGGTQRLQRLIGMSRAKEIIFTAERYDAETMAEYGLVNELTEDGELEGRAMDLARDLAAGPPIAQKFTKRAMHRGWGDVDAGLEIESQAFGILTTTDDLMEGITAFMGDRDPEFEGE
jgi:enoyl-CoA hydratase/3-hydroxyacyl-CoA dehydrogenase